MRLLALLARGHVLILARGCLPQPQGRASSLRSIGRLAETLKHHFIALLWILKLLTVAPAPLTPTVDRALILLLLLAAPLILVSINQILKCLHARLLFIALVLGRCRAILLLVL